jgi:prolipoprotein diacylglyceryl transferase
MTAAAALAAVHGTLAASIPSPSQGVWHLGFVPIRAYAFAILAGIVVAVLVCQARWAALGGVGAWIGCRRLNVSYPAFADALAPGLLFAQAIGRLGNYFNEELFGRPTDLPWGLEIDPAHRPLGYQQYQTFQPTFLYELLWNTAGGLLLIWLDRRFKLGHGRVFWLYVMIYTTGRVWIEALRIDDAEHILGLRLNIWTSILVWVGALVAFIVVGRRHQGREKTVELAAKEPEHTDAA